MKLRVGPSAPITDQCEFHDRVGALGDSQLTGVVVHVGGGKVAICDFSGSGDVELDLWERLGVRTVSMFSAAFDEL